MPGQGSLMFPEKDLPKGYWAYYWKSGTFMVAGFIVLMYTANYGFLAVNWSGFFIAGAYVISFLLHLVYWRLDPKWREISKFQALRNGVAYMPVAGPLVSVVAAPAFLVMPLLAAGLILIETRFSSAEEIKFTSIQSSPDPKSHEYNDLDISDDLGSNRFSVPSKPGSPFDGAATLNGRVLTGIFGNRYLLKLSR